MGSSFTGPVKHAVKGSSAARQWYSGLPIGEDTSYAVYFNDFLNTADYAAADWTQSTTEAGAGSASRAIAANERGGALLLTNDDADNDLISDQLNEETFSLTAGKQCWFETRLKINDVDQVDDFFGLCITDTTPLVATDRVGFQITDGDASIDCLTEKNSTETNTDSAKDAADDTYVKLGFWYNGAGSVKFFVDGANVAEHTANIPDDENLAITFHHQNGEAAAQTLTIDYIYCAMER